MLLKKVDVQYLVRDISFVFSDSCCKYKLSYPYYSYFISTKPELCSYKITYALLYTRDMQAFDLLKDDTVSYLDKIIKSLYDGTHAICSLVTKDTAYVVESLINGYTERLNLVLSCTNDWHNLTDDSHTEDWPISFQTPKDINDLQQWANLKERESLRR